MSMISLYVFILIFTAVFLFRFNFVFFIWFGFWFWFFFCVNFCFESYFVVHLLKTFVFGSAFIFIIFGSLIHNDSPWLMSTN